VSPAAHTFRLDRLDEVEAALRDACGVTLTATLRGTLAEACRRAASAEGLAPEAFLERLRGSDVRCAAALVDAAVVCETFFFRHPEQLDAVRARLLAPAPRDRPLSIWSAGCATGEEPYSLAIGLLEAGRAGCGDRILATDVSARALAGAAAGVYGAWSLRRMPRRLREAYFEGPPGRVSVRAEVRAPVALARHNLVREPPPAAGFDLVACRNVLIYFDRETARRVAATLAGALAPGGLLALGPVEDAAAEGLGLERIEVGGATLFRRAEAARREPRPARRPPAIERRARRRPAAPAQPDEARRAPPPSPPPQVAPAAGFEAAREAARRGDAALAERIAADTAPRELSPEAYLLLATAAEARGDLAAAVEAARRALYLDPRLAMAHALLAALHARLGRRGDAARARRNALASIEALDDAAPLRALEPITAGALRSALGCPRRRAAGETRSEA
jgi:chemotaxis protein methyltransferase CheR